MRHALVIVVMAVLLVPRAAAQSLFVAQGERAVEGAIGWSVGPFSNGVEIQASASLDGRWDVGFGVNRFVADFGGADDTTLVEWSPSARYFLFKEQDDRTPVSFAVQGAWFQSHYEGGSDDWYAVAGGQLFKRLVLGEGLSLFPYVGFALAAESSAFGGGPATRALYLTRQFGVHGLVTLGADTWLRITAEEQAFRRETFRAARVAYVRRF